MSKVISQAFTQLTAPAQNTSWLDLGRISPAAADVEVIVAAINTDVTYTVQYSDDGSAVAASSPITARTANGTYISPVSPKHKYVRVNFTAETGGTAVTLDVTITAYTN